MDEFSYSEWLLVFSPVMGLTVNVFCQIFCFRNKPEAGLLKSIYLGFLAGILWVVCFEIAVGEMHNLAFGLLVNLTIYGALGYCYFHFINLSETARRIRIIRELLDAPEGLTLEELLLRYGAKDMVDLRIKRMIGSGQIIFKENRYFIGKPFLLTISRIIRGMKILILGKQSEFE